MTAEWLKKVEALTSEVCEREGCALYDLQFAGSAGAGVLRVFVDKIPGGISIEDCANISRALCWSFDVHGLEPGREHFELEVSSPGVERRLDTLKQYQLSVGHWVRINLNPTHLSIGVEAAMKPRTGSVTEVVGQLVAVDEETDTIQLEVPDSDAQVFERLAIAKARTILRPQLKSSSSKVNKKSQTQRERA